MNHVTTGISTALVAALALSGCTGWKRFMYEGFGRDRWQQPERVIGELEIEPGASIADLGAGGGYFTFRLADAAGPSGVVYAVDIDDGMLAYLKDRAATEGYANVKTVRARPEDPGLPEEGVDLIFTSNTYHHIEDRPAYFGRLERYLRAGGRIAIVESKRQGFFHTLFGHATEDDVIRTEMEAAGYEVARELDFVSSQSFLIFVPKRD